MKFWKTFDIDILRLKDGEHVFSFEIGKNFLNQFQDNKIVSDGNLEAKITLNKQTNVIEALYEINGTVKLTCDRSLEVFDHPLDIKEKILYKYGQEEKEINEEIYTITRDTPRINVAQLIYEFILLAIPAKKIHPDYLEEMDEEDFDEEGKLVYIDKGEDDTDPENGDASDDGKPINPMWEILRNLKKKE